jgi:predicted MFS family arabinose efflux permease
MARFLSNHLKDPAMDTTSAPPAALPRSLLASAVLVLLLAMGVRATFGLFMQPMGLANGWSRDTFSLAFAIQNLVWGFGAILLGAMADKFGSARTIALAAVLYVVGLLGTRFATSPLELYLTAGVLVGLGQAGTTFAVVLPVVARAVPVEQRSTAMGIASAGGSLGQFLVVPAAQQMIAHWDWMAAMLVLTAIVGAILPLTSSLRGVPSAGTQQNQSLTTAIREAVGHGSYHLLFWSYFVCGFHTAFITLHLPAYVQDKGLTATHGAAAVATIGLLNVFGSYWAGRLGGLYSKKQLLVWIYALRAVFIAVLLMFPVTPLTLYIFAGGMGLMWLGTVPLTNGLVAQIYGMRYASTLSGIIFLGHQVGSFIGVWLGGKLYVRTGSYDVVWWMGIGLALMAAALCWPIREQPIERAVASA